MFIQVEFVRFINLKFFQVSEFKKKTDAKGSEGSD
jgi:hypothetical protein